jgi:hypothetical protein
LALNKMLRDSHVLVCSWAAAALMTDQAKVYLPISPTPPPPPRTS